MTKQQFDRVLSAAHSYGKRPSDIALHVYSAVLVEGRDFSEACKEVHFNQSIATKQLGLYARVYEGLFPPVPEPQLKPDPKPLEQAPLQHIVMAPKVSRGGGFER